MDFLGFVTSTIELPFFSTAPVSGLRASPS